MRFFVAFALPFVFHPITGDNAPSVLLYHLFFHKFAPRTPKKKLRTTRTSAFLRDEETFIPTLCTSRLYGSVPAFLRPWRQGRGWRRPEP